MAKVLVVDDSELVLDFVRAALEAAGHEVTTCANPFNAFVLISRQDPDLVLLDLSMPGVQGDDLLEIVRDANGKIRAKVLLLSSHDVPTLKRACARSGADGFICKNDDASALADEVDRWLSA